MAPPDRHLLVHDGTLRLTRGPRENSCRPAADPLFRSAARAYGPRVVGVVLSGNLDDGTAGLQAVKLRGGISVVQDPADALVPGMPESALRNVAVDHVVPASNLATLLTTLAHQIAAEEGGTPMPDEMANELDRVEQEAENMETKHSGPDRMLDLGPPSGFSCPECGGSLWELHNGQLARYRCHVGHAYSPESLADGQSQAVEEALWTAIRALEERAALLQRLADRVRGQGMKQSLERYEAQVHDAKQHAAVVRRLLAHTVTPTAEPDSPGGRATVPLPEGP